MQNKKNNFSLIIGSLVIILGVFSGGYFVGQKNVLAINKVYGISNKDTKVVTDADFAPFWKVWNVLNEKSIFIKDVDDQDKVWNAIEGLVNATNDPYTVFFRPEENKLFQEEIHGSFSGIGAEIDKKDNILTIVSPLKNTPAEKSGLKTGDKILMIDNEDATNITIDKAISKIRGPKGSIVVLTILRDEEKKTRNIEIVRDTIDIPTIKTKIEDGVFIINFYTFSENSASLFKEALNEFQNSKLDKMVIDLRGNPGGYLDSAIEITGWFLDTGKTIAIQDFNDNRKPILFKSRGPKIINDNVKIMILVDNGSASASEIMAGAMSEYGIAKLVGTQTFGKGSVQELVDITEDTSLKVTIAKWLTPKGLSISVSGLTPDYEVKITQESVEEGRDLQLEKAIELLK